MLLQYPAVVDGDGIDAQQIGGGEMSEKFTKGPWWVESDADEEGEGTFYVCHEGTNSPDTTICAFKGCDQDDEANAHLIAAAPELWAALAAMVEHDEYVIECGVMMPFVELERAKAALKKARGEI